MGILVKAQECVENMKKWAYYTNKELFLLPSAIRTSPVKASNMLSLAPGGDDHGTLHWYWTGGLMLPVELPVPVCSADAWIDSVAVQPCHVWPESGEQAQQGQGGLWYRNAILVTAVCGEQESYPARCVGSRETKVKASRRGGGMLEAWSEWAITAIKVQI